MYPRTDAKSDPAKESKEQDSATDSSNGTNTLSYMTTERRPLVDVPNISARLNSGGSLLLLTPIVLHHPSTPREDLNMDPFEILGRALCTHGYRVKHLSYRPSNGIVQIPKAFIERSETVVLVLCDALPSGKGLGETNNVHLQEQFAAAFEMASRQLSNDFVKVKMIFGTSFGPLSSDPHWWDVFLRASSYRHECINQAVEVLIHGQANRVAPPTRPGVRDAQRDL